MTIFDVGILFFDGILQRPGEPTATTTAGIPKLAFCNNNKKKKNVTNASKAQYFSTVFHWVHLHTL